MSSNDRDMLFCYMCSPAAPLAEAARFDPACQTSTVLALAEGINLNDAFELMPILADALEDAGCDNEFLLQHCRHAKKHESCCWVLPLILAVPVQHIPAPKERSLFVDAVLHVNKPGYRPPIQYDPLLYLTLVFLTLGSGMLLVALLQSSEDSSYFEIGLIAGGVTLAGLAVLYISSLLSVLRRRRIRRGVMRSSPHRR